MDKKEYLQAIGVYPLISLKEARKRATESRSLIANGINPVEEARKEKAIDALNMAAGFKTVAEDWFATRVSGWSESYTKQVRSALEKDVYPVLGKRSIVDITARDVLALLQKKERTAPEQARKLRQRIGEIFKFAVITELVTRNPVRPAFLSLIIPLFQLSGINYSISKTYINIATIKTVAYDQIMIFGM